MHHHGKNATRQMSRIVPTLELECFCSFWIFAARRGRVRIAAIGANQSVDHELERTRCLIPVDRANNHDALGGYPTRIDFRHPVTDLTHRVIRIAGARPMAKRHRGGDARLARVDDASVLRSEPTQVEQIDFEAPYS